MSKSVLDDLDLPLDWELTHSSRLYMERKARQPKRSLPRKVVHAIGRFFKGIYDTILLLFKFFFRCIWALILLAIFLPIVILFWIPWTWFPSTCPTLYIAYLKKDELIRTRVKQKYDARDDEDRVGEARDFFAYPGSGSEQNAPLGKRSGNFWKGRPWELYELMRECWRTINRQGLQIGGVLSGFTIFWCHIAMMVDAYHNPAVGRLFPKMPYS